jgi:hypothetical protein
MQSLSGGRQGTQGGGGVMGGGDGGWADGGQFRLLMECEEALGGGQGGTAGGGAGGGWIHTLLFRFAVALTAEGRRKQVCTH